METSNPPMTYFHGFCNNGNCCLWYVGGNLELRNLYFWGLESQYDVVMVHYLEAFLAKISDLKPVFAYKTHL